jgi:hypothetical protein
MIRLTLLIFLLFIFFSVSSAIIYHIWRYSPEKNRSVVLIIVYVAVSITLLIASISAYVSIDWEGLF